MTTEILITGDGSPTLSISDTGETYHSRHGALAESRHVFIENGLSYVRKSNKDALNVFELGFGTGLNAALTLLKSAEWDQKIFFHSLELFPPSTELVKTYATFYSHEVSSAIRTVNEVPWNKLVHIDKNFSILKEQMDFLSWSPSINYDVVYYDAFAPSTAPHLWTVECFAKLNTVMNPGAALVTFCAKGEVKRAMRASGLGVERLPGAPGKREMTRARKV